MDPHGLLKGVFVGEFERNLAEQAEAERKAGVKSNRCAECGNMYTYCTCGSNVPWDCGACIRGRGKGERGTDRLCPKHTQTGFPPRNRAERRQGKIAAAKMPHRRR